jgi:AcrR family transcriptional regulator
MFKSTSKHAGMPTITKGAVTRQHVLDTALALFRRQGFARTTMRDIAGATGLSLGAAYHYFPSKDALVMAYYEWMQAEHERLVEAERSSGSDLKSRIATLFATKLELLRRDRKLLGAMFGNLGDPAHPLSVFGRGTSSIRERSLAQFTAVFADPAVPEELRALLGRLLWLIHLGVFLFFIHDNSPKQARTFALVDALVDLAASAIPLISHPFAGPIRRRILDLMSYLDGERQVTA